LDKIEENEGVLTPELEEQWDVIISDMAETSDELANTLDYIDTAIEVAKKKKDRYVSKQRQLENYKNRIRDTAKHLLLQGVDFKGEDRSVALMRRKPEWNVDGVIVEDLKPEYVKVTYTIRKAELKKAIAEGKVMPPAGAELKRSESLVIR
jgi:hypothetical protein